MGCLTLLLLLTSGVLSRQDTGKLVLDAMQRNFTGQPFDAEMWASFGACMEQASHGSRFSLKEVETRMWEGFLEYGRSEGSAEDPWDGRNYWLEYNPQPLAPNNDYIPGATTILITQPCNYVSNIAYYQGMLTLCARDPEDWAMRTEVTHLLISSYNKLAAGSAFFHGSGTRLGGTLDNVPIGHIALASYQAMVYHLPANRLVADASIVPTQPGHNATDEIHRMARALLDEGVYDWNHIISRTGEHYQDNYYISFGTIVLTLMRMGLEDDVTDVLLPFLAELMPLDPEEIAFLIELFDPALRQVLEQGRVQPSEEDKVVLVRRGLGTFLKLMYAFFWQEQTFKGDWLSSESANELGATMMPPINTLGDFLTGYWHPENVRDSNNVFPGEEVCRPLIAHAKWHEQSSNALVDLILLTDDGNKIILGQPLDTASEPGDLGRNTTNSRAKFVSATSRGCFSAFSDASLVSTMLDEAAGVAQCLGHQNKSLEHTLDNDHRLLCVSRWLLGREHDTMDGCLVQNDCLSLSLASVQSCASSKCVQHVPLLRRPLLASCLRACGGFQLSGAVCAGECLASHTALSKTGQALVQCAPLLVNPHADGFRLYAEMSACLAAHLSAESTFWKAMAHSAQCMLDEAV